MWKYLAHGKSSWHLSFFFSWALIKVHWIPYCVSGPPFPFPRASHLRSPFHPCHCGLNSVFTFIYLWRKRPQAQLGFGSAERYYFCIYGSWTQRMFGWEMPRGIIAVHCLQTWLLTRRLLCPTPRLLLSQVQCGAQESVFGKSVLRDSDGQSVWGRTYLASVHFADENTEA